MCAARRRDAHAHLSEFGIGVGVIREQRERLVGEQLFASVDALLDLLVQFAIRCAIGGLEAEAARDGDRHVLPNDDIQQIVDSLVLLATHILVLECAEETLHQIVRLVEKQLPHRLKLAVVVRPLGCVRVPVLLEVRLHIVKRERAEKRIELRLEVVELAQRLGKNHVAKRLWNRGRVNRRTKQMKFNTTNEKVK